MTKIEMNKDGFVIDAALIAEAFKLPVEDVQQLMRDGKITSLCETGIHEDAGRMRLTFTYSNRSVRYVVDEAGTILKRAGFPARAKATTSEVRPHT